MLIAELDRQFPDFINQKPDISDLVVFYQNSKKRFDEDEDFKKVAHENVVKLQSGDEHVRAGWQMLCEISRQEFQKIYQRLDIKIEEKGESFYNPFLKPMVEELQGMGIVKEDGGAQCIFVPKSKTPVIIQKSDGGFGYATTDLAALRYRAQELKADRIVVVTDKSQEFHFKQFIKAGELAKFYDPKVTQFNHMTFGMVL
jgi:arginyl-tRNA synthetase